MTIEQRKISLINWITNLEDEILIDQIEGFRKTTFDELPNEIVQLLKISDAEGLDDCEEHTNVRDIIGRK